MALITVYIPTRNRPALLLRAVASCLAQTETDFELLIVDDCSDSEHRQSIQAIAQLDRRIRIVQQAANLGACAARNIAIAEANGEFITGLDDDDEFTPDRLATFLALWRSKPQFAFLCSAARFQLNGGKTIKAFRGSKLIRIDDLLSANVVGNQVFTKTDYLRSVGGFDEQLPACQDYDAWVRLASRYGPGFRHEKATYIVRQDHLLPRISSSTKVLTGYQQFMRKHEQLMTPVQVRSQLFLQKLYGTNAGFFTLLAAAPLRMYPIALKVGLLRAVGYAL